MQTKFILFLAGVCLFASCAKNVDSEGSIDASKSKMLQDGSWQLKAYMINPNIADTNAVPVDAYQLMDGCQKDNYWIFHDAHTLVDYESFTKCQAAAPDSAIYQYLLSENEDHMTVWSNPDDPEHSVVLDGHMTYPSIDTFLVDFQVYDSVSELTSEHEMTYVKMQ